MPYKTMIVVEDEEFGGLGLKFKNKTKFCNGMFTAQEGLIIAHDIIEHQQGTAKIGSIGDEMLALGGVCYARGQWGQMRRGGIGSVFSPAESIASDITNMAHLYFDQQIPFRQKLVKTRGEDQSTLVDDVIEAARETFGDAFYEDYDVSDQDRDSYLADCQTYMLHGVTLAVRRFGSGLVAHDMFWAIEEAANSIIKHIEFTEQEYRLQYDTNGARMYEIEPPYEW